MVPIPTMDDGAVIGAVGERIHAQHGPIDLVITVDGPPGSDDHALARLHDVFPGLLAELVVDLDVLRRPAPISGEVTGTTARRMVASTTQMAEHGFLTPMAAVAGAVADTVCDALWHEDLQRLIVNNGGDIAFRLAHGASMTVALADVGSGELGGPVRLHDSAQVHGIATSGRGGRSLTMGIADSVTVFAADAATADAAATLIASVVDLPGHRSIQRCPAVEIDSASDLGERLVVHGVGPLTVDDCETAVERGMALARTLRDDGHIAAAAVRLRGVAATLGSLVDPLLVTSNGTADD